MTLPERRPRGYEGKPVPPGALPGAVLSVPSAMAARYVFAGWPRRVAAALLDVAVLLLVTVLGVVVLALVIPPGGSGLGRLLAWIGLTGLAVLLAMVVYLPLASALTRGRSLGKLALGIRVVRADDRPVGPAYSLYREVVVKGLVFFVPSLFLFGLPLLVDVSWPLFEPEKQALHDLICQSRVVLA